MAEGGKKDFVDFEKLIVYDKAMELIDAIYAVTEKFPSTEAFNLTSQLNRAATSVCLNIGEGTGGSKKEFIYFLNVVRRSVRGCTVAITIALRRKYIGQEDEINLRKTLI